MQLWSLKSVQNRAVKSIHVHRVYERSLLNTISDRQLQSLSQLTGADNKQHNVWTYINAAQSDLSVNFELQFRRRQSTTVDEHVRELQQCIQLNYYTHFVSFFYPQCRLWIFFHAAFRPFITMTLQTRSAAQIPKVLVKNVSLGIL